MPIRPVSAFLLLLLSCLALRAEDASPTANPWGISTSSGSLRNADQWLPKMAAVGVTSVRLFPEWREVEPTKGAWKFERMDALLKAATASKIEINALLMGSVPTNKRVHEFPMEDLAGWAGFVEQSVGRYKHDIHAWEVWNEGNGGFNDGKHTTTDYAKLALTTYAAAKKADPNAQVGLSVASFDAPYLHQVMLAMAKEGKPSSFDFLAIHPYEIADGIADPDGEIPFLWMTRRLRDTLHAAAPQRENCPIWITEIGRRIDNRRERLVTDEDAASALVKFYTMAIAQGIERTQWFEAQDAPNEDQGFGLLTRDGKERPSYKAFATLAAHLGPNPKLAGWLALGRAGRGYGFVFRGKTKPVLVAWMPKGKTSTAEFAEPVEVIDALDGTVTKLPADEFVSLSDRPVLVCGLPEQVLEIAKKNGETGFPWGGDFSHTTTVTGMPGSPDESRGIFQLSRDSTPVVKFADGTTGILCRGDQATTYFVHPTFAKFDTQEYYVRVTIRRVAPGNVGFNLNYEAADSRGQTPYKNREIWFGATPANEWQTFTWHVTDACFSKMWGYDIAFRPEQSVPFVIGKIEISTEPLK